ncbi:MAG: Crp/Fnr family transcriptional regulator [Spirosomataceae bacterium]
MQEFRQFINSLYPISNDSWEQFSGLFKIKYLKKGEIFINQGEFAKEIGFLRSGVMRGFFRDDNGNEYNKHIFVTPCFIGGYASLITKRPNLIIQEALTDCEVFVANFNDYETLFDTYPEIERVARRLAEIFFVVKEQKEIEIVLLDAEKRYEIFKKQYPQIEQLIPQYQIASYLGITPIQLSRIRRKSAKSS